MYVRSNIYPFQPLTDNHRHSLVFVFVFVFVFDTEVCGVTWPTLLHRELVLLLCRVVQISLMLRYLGSHRA